MTIKYPEVPGHAPGSPTSAAAAGSVAPHAGRLRERVWDRIDLAPDGLTCDEVEVLLEMRHQTAAARIRELVLAGRLKDSGRTRPTRSGRRAVVWVVA